MSQKIKVPEKNIKTLACRPSSKRNLAPRERLQGRQMGNHEGIKRNRRAGRKAAVSRRAGLRDEVGHLLEGVPPDVPIGVA